MDPTTPYEETTAPAPATSTIPRVEVISSNVKSVGHDDATQTLAVEFHAGKDGVPRVYHYTPVARAFYDRLFEGHSIGKLVHGLRRDPTVACEQVDQNSAQPD